MWCVAYYQGDEYQGWVPGAAAHVCSLAEIWAQKRQSKTPASEEGKFVTQLSDYLTSFDHISAVTPMTIELKTNNHRYYDACSYIARFSTPEGSVAWNNGERHYWRSFIYVLGELPSYYRRNSRTVFAIDNDPSDWYVACYWPELRNQKQNLSASHPIQKLGPNFLLAPWDAKDPIDYYDSTPRPRVRININPIAT